jgi:hypothetical protein
VSLFRVPFHGVGPSIPENNSTLINCPVLGDTLSKKVVKSASALYYLRRLVPSSCTEVGTLFVLHLLELIDNFSCRAKLLPDDYELSGHKNGGKGRVFEKISHLVSKNNSS